MCPKMVAFPISNFLFGAFYFWLLFILYCTIPRGQNYTFTGSSQPSKFQQVCISREHFLQPQGQFSVHQRIHRRSNQNPKVLRSNVDLQWRTGLGGEQREKRMTASNEKQNLVKVLFSNPLLKTPPKRLLYHCSQIR